MDDISASKQIDDIINQYGGWKASIINPLRDAITDASSEIKEEVKWKTPSRPEGLPVWTSNGIVCFIEIWNDNIILIFFKGAQLSDPHKLFNSRLKSSSLRAIEFHEGDNINTEGIIALVVEAVDLNAEKANRSKT